MLFPFQTKPACRTTEELIKVFSRYGIPDVLHSDQGRNFKSTILLQTLEAFVISKSRTTAYHPAVDGQVEYFNRSLLQLLHVYAQHHNYREQYLPLVLLIEQLFILLQVCHHLNWCMDAVHTSHLCHQNSTWCDFLSRLTLCKIGTAVWLCWTQQCSS